MHKLATGEQIDDGLAVAEGALSPPEVLAVLRDVAKANPNTDSIAWLIAEGEKVVGMVSFTRFVSNKGAVLPDDRRDFGYVVAPGERCRGVATAIAALVEISRARGLQMLTAETEHGNPASERVLMKNGFRRSSPPARFPSGELVRWSLALQS